MAQELNVEQLADDVTQLFGADNLAAAFITGGSICSWGDERSDIDILVCHYDDVDQTRRNEFTDYYLQMHRRLNRVPDEISPGEVMSLQQMHHGLTRVDQLEPTRIVAERDDFDYICWAGMLVSKKLMLVPRSSDLNEIEVFARQIVDKWSEALYPGMKLTEGQGLKTDKDKVLGSIMSCPGYYEAHE